MKILRLAFAFVGLGCAAAAVADDAHPSMYSFADVYRLTVSGAPGAAAFADAAPQVRAAAIQPASAAEPRFTVSGVPGPGRWMLLLAGLAAAGWVAHRRLTRAY